LEKERLEEELKKLEARQSQIQQRLAILNGQTIPEENITHQQRNTGLKDKTPKFKTITLEY
jgi:hypothetical protein